ncbi:MAG: hypothetical protein ACWGNK_12955 [Desulfobacterales bacterium]
MLEAAEKIDSVKLTALHLTHGPFVHIFFSMHRKETVLAGAL